MFKGCTYFRKAFYCWSRLKKTSVKFNRIFIVSVLKDESQFVYLYVIQRIEGNKQKVFKNMRITNLPAGQGPQAPGMSDAACWRGRWFRRGPILGPLLRRGSAGEPWKLHIAWEDPLHSISDVRVLEELDAWGLLRGVPVSLDGTGQACERGEVGIPRGRFGQN